MIDINEIEEGVLIEASEFNYCIENLVNDITARGKGLSREEIYRFACNIIGSLLARGLVKLVRTTCKEVEEDLYDRVSERELTDEELDLILQKPDKWDERDVFSITEVYEMSITGEGRKALP